MLGKLNRGNMIKDRIIQKNNVIQKIRNFLLTNGYIETNTPIIRKSSSIPFPRIRIECQDEKYLRDSMEMALRYNLSFVDKIFEIGQCFRNENNNSHLSEFIMIELYVVDKKIDYLMKLSSQIVNLFFVNKKIETFSIANFIKRKYKCDLVKENEVKFINLLRKKYNDKRSLDYKLINKFIEKEIEPLSKDKVVIFKDYPICTISSARKIEETKSLINRFELFIDGIEIMHAYEDENDIDCFVKRSEKVDLYNYEEKIIVGEIEKGNLPSNTAGLGIGIERLCMTIYHVNDINEYFFSSNF